MYVCVCVGGGNVGGRRVVGGGGAGANGLLTQLPILQTFTVNIKQLCQTHTQSTKSPPKEREKDTERDVANWVTFNYRVFTFVFVTLNILQSQFAEKAFKKTENSEQNMVLLLFLFTPEKHSCQTNATNC